MFTHYSILYNVSLLDLSLLFTHHTDVQRIEEICKIRIASYKT